MIIWRRIKAWLFGTQEENPQEENPQEEIAKRMTVDIKIKPHPFLTETRSILNQTRTKPENKSKIVKSGPLKGLPRFSRHCFMDGYTIDAHR
jgi:ribosomal protein L31